MSTKFEASADPHRPTYHFLPPSNWMNDPNGLIQWNGTYHLFYQYNPNGAFWGTMHWGHAKSDDLVNWTHMPIALAPDPEGPDADGCFSGCAVNVDDRPTLMYTGVRGNSQLPCVAISPKDDLATWEKLPYNPVIESPPRELDTTIFRDHSILKDRGLWYQVIGSGIKGIGGTALLYRSSDFLTWSFVGSLVPLEQVAKGIAKDATGWECPDFFQVSDQHVLIAAMWDERPICVAYFVGNFLDEQFVPKSSGVVDGGESFYAPQSFTDERGRRVMLGWLRETRSVEDQIEAGWSGAMSLPRIVSVLNDGSLSTAPAPEVQQLRGRHIEFSAEDLSSGTLDLDDIPGDSMELLLTMASDMTGSVEVEALRSSDGTERTKIIYDADAGRLTVDTSQSSRSQSAEGGIFSIDAVPMDADSPFLRVFVDHSIIEVFFNDQRCITARAYPVNGREVGCRVVATTGARAFQGIDAWELKPGSFSIM